MENISFEQVKKHSPCFFLGANGSNGFVNGFGECYFPEKGEKLYIIKGGPGTGKSTFMKDIAVYMKDHNIDSELYFCSSDPNSLDGVRFPSLGIAIVDGTAPHVMEPKMLGITEEIVNVGNFLDSKKLSKEKCIPLYRQNALFHKKASRFLGAASRLMDDTFTLACNGCDMEKLEQTAVRISRDMIPHREEEGGETKRFLSGFTPDGLVLLENTLSYFADTIIAVEDEYGAVSSVFLSLVREHALRSGYEIITCPCALSSDRKIDHIIIPALQLAFCTTNWFLPITVDTSRRIHARRFYDLSYLNGYKQRLRFNRRAAEELFDGAYQNLKEAKEIHDDLEKYYIEAMDFDGMTNLLSDFKQKLQL